MKKDKVDRIMVGTVVCFNSYVCFTLSVSIMHNSYFNKEGMEAVEAYNKKY